MSEDCQQLERALNEIRTLDAVVVLGAGVSFVAGMPLAGQLAPLVWHTLDSHANVLRECCEIIGVSVNTGKNAVGDDWNRIRSAFGRIAVDSAARRTFQLSVAKLNDERTDKYSIAHVALARLVHAGRISNVVSLNWDTLLEVAFMQRYGIGINSQSVRLWKPHGDCSRPEDSWVLPHESGRIPDVIVEQLAALASERPRVLIIVGYSERDDVVVERLIGPFARRWHVFRISPSASSEGAIRLSAIDALQQIANGLCPEPDLPGWEFVTFANQRGIEAAVAGARLGPQDVDVCPRLPHYDSALRNLELLHKVEIAGNPGCGKSITAWQLAREYNRRDFEVIRPDPAHSLGAEKLIQAVIAQDWKRVILIDDTQTFPAGFIARFAEFSGPNLKLIFGTTDIQGAKSRSVRIPAQVAVETLAHEFQRRRDELLPIVRRFDSAVGDEYCAIPIERRIESAAKSETPWQFAFVLRGGWRQASEQLNVLRDFDRADLLLVLVAARQLLSRDVGCTFQELVHDATVINRTEEWVRSGIDFLKQRGVILPSGHIRCLHGEAAAVVIRSTLKDRREDTFPLVATFLRRMVSDVTEPCLGLRWLLEDVLRADAFLHAGTGQEGFFVGSMLEDLVNKSFSSSEPTKRRDAAFLLSRLLWHRELDVSRLRSELPVIRQWIETATPENAFGVADLVNSIDWADKTIAQQLILSIDPDAVWARVKTARTSDGYAWGHFLSRLAVAATDKWRAEMKSRLPKDHLFKFVRDFLPSELSDVAEFIEGVANVDFNFCLDCLKEAIPILQQGFSEDALNAYISVSDLVHWILGHGLFGDECPSKKQRRLSKEITEGIEPDLVTTGIVTCRFGEWETYSRLLWWVRNVNPKKHKAIVNALDWNLLDNRMTPFWERPRREMRLLLSSLQIGKDGQPVRGWLTERAERMNEIDPILSGASPEAAIAVFRKGGRVNLAGHNKSDWRLQARAVARVSQIDQSIAIGILESNRDHIVGRLSKLDAIDSEEFPIFLKLVEHLAPSLLTHFCRAVDFRTATEKWPSLFRDHRKEVRRGARQVLTIISHKGEGEIANLAKQLLATRRRRNCQQGRSG